MKKYIYIILMGVLCSVFMCGCDSDEKETRVLRLAETYGEDHIITKADYEFAKLVEEKSNGTIIVEVHPNSEYGDDKEVFKSVLDGSIDFASVNMSVCGSDYEATKSIELPFLFNDSGHMWRAVQQAVGPKLDLEMSTKGGKILAYMNQGARNLYTTKPVSGIEDLENLKIRCFTPSSISDDYISLIGAKYTEIDYNEVENALQNNTIDGAEDTLGGYYESGHYKFAPNLFKIQFRYIPNMLVVNKEFYDGLTQKEQDIISSAASEASLRQRENFESYEKEIEEKLKAEGCKITEPDEGVMNYLKDEAEWVYKQIPREDVEVTLLEQVRAMQ